MRSVAPFRPFGHGVLLKLRQFIDDRRGAGAIEFAIVIPLLIMAYVSAFEVSVAMSMSRKVGRAASTVSDLLTKNETTTATILDSMTDVTKSVIAPYSQDGYSLKITGIAVDSSGKATVAWSRNEQAKAAYTAGSTVTLPTDMDAKDAFFVRTELNVPYTILLLAPSLESSFNKINLGKTSYFRLRTGTKITCTGC